MAKNNQSSELEDLLSNFRASDAVSGILSRAFSAQGHALRTGLDSQVRPFSVLLMIVRQGFDSHEIAVSNSLAASIARSLAMQSDEVDNLNALFMQGFPESNDATVMASPELFKVLSYAARIRDQVSSNEWLAARHLLAALIQEIRKDAELSSLMSKHLDVDWSFFVDRLENHLNFYRDEDQPERWLTVLAGLRGEEVEKLGGGINLSRVASDGEQCLNVEEYATVLAELFAQAKGEFCFAIYGAWGRGKTFMVERMAEFLSRQSGYQAVWFSAWRFPTAPEVWVHLYETFAIAAFERSKLVAIPNVLRTAIVKRGSGKLLLAYLLLAVGVVPIVDVLQMGATAARVLYSTLGIAGVIWLASIIRGVQKTDIRLSKEYLTASRHTEKLGLQATIGSDLRALLLGWMPQQSLGKTFVYCYWAATAILMFATWRRLTGGRGLESWLSDNVGVAANISWDPMAAAAVAGGIGLLAAAAMAWITRGGAPPKKVILVVDDLDRCSPDHLLSVMESIKLLLEEPEVSQRVQVVMLLEEDILRHAIYEKYGKLLDERRAQVLGTRFGAEQIVRENTEKLFTAHIRLPPLGLSEIRDLIDAFSGIRKELLSQREELIQERNALKRQVDAQPSGKVPVGSKPIYRMRVVRGELDREDTGLTETIFRSATSEELEQERKEIAELASKAKPSLENVERRIQSIHQRLSIPFPVNEQIKAASSAVLEKAEIQAIVHVLTRGDALHRDLGPRAIRAFLFRYQLARLLLNKLYVPWHPKVLAHRLAESLAAPKHEDDTAAVEPNLMGSQSLNRVVRLVS